MKLTRKQAKEFARIQTGILILNTSGTEFEETSLTDYEIDLCYTYMSKHYKKLLKEEEYRLSSTKDILDYVVKHF